MTMFKKTLTSGGKQVSKGNDVIIFNPTPDSSTYTYNVQYLHFKTYDKPCSIKLNDENTIHWIDINSEFVISNIYIGKFTIVDPGVTYYYTALSID